MTMHLPPGDPSFDDAPTSAASARAVEAGTPPDALQPGQRVEGFRVVELIGRGGMGEVYRAEQVEPVRRMVALKLMRSQRVDARHLAYFELERQLLARMQHPCIGQIFDAGTTAEGHPYFAMELIDGEPLHRYCENRRLTLRQRLGLFIRICEGVQHAHQKGVIHRDLKPGNLLVTEVDGRALPKIIDFGISTAAGRIGSLERADGARTHGIADERVGTPDYMSPEQQYGAADEVDTRSDVYSLGVVLFELISGRRPAHGGYTTGDSNSAATTDRRPSAALQDGDRAAAAARERGLSLRDLRQLLRSELDWVVMKAMRHERGDRYASAAELAEDLRRFLHDEPLAAVPPQRSYRLVKFIRRHRVIAAAGAIAATALVAGLTLALYGLQQARRQQAIAEARQVELEQVSAFQRAMLKDVDIEAMGAGLARDLHANLQRALQDAPDAAGTLATFDRLLARSSPTDAARLLLDRHLLGNAAHIAARDFAAQPLLAAELDYGLGEAYQAIGRYAAAGDAFRRVWQRREAELGPQHRKTLEAMLSAAFAIERAGRFDDAAEIYAQVTSRSAALPPRHTLRVQLALAQSLNLAERGRRDEARALQEALLEQVRRERGDDDEWTLKVGNNLGITLARMRALDEARAVLEDVHARRLRLLGAEHADTLATATNLAAARGMAGDVEGALELQQRVYEIARGKFGDTHTSTLLYLNNLASSQSRIDPNAARATLERVIALRREAIGARHPQTLASISNLATVLQQLGELDAGDALHAEALAGRIDVLGAQHPDTLVSMANRAESLRRLQRYDEAWPLARDAYDRRVQLLGAAHPNTVDNADLVAQIALARRDWAAAEAPARAALAARAGASGAADWRTQRSAWFLHAALVALDRDAEAEELRRDYLQPLLAQDPATLDDDVRALQDEVRQGLAP